MAVSKDKTRVMVTIPADTKEQLEREAEIENRSLSNHIATILQKYVKDNER